MEKIMALMMDVKAEDGVLNRIKKIIVEVLKVNESEISLKTNYRIDLDADSVDLAELLMALEDEFKTCIPDDGLSKFQTVGDTIRYISSTI